MDQKVEVRSNAALRDISITSLINAPREVVWRAWTEPKHVAKWWGSHGFTAPVCKLDVRPGGAILIHMRGPRGSPFDVETPMQGIFQEVSVPMRLVFGSSALFAAAGNTQVETLNTVTFEEYNGRTRLTLHAAVSCANAAATGAVAGMEQGWRESLERLAKLVST